MAHRKQLGMLFSNNR